MATRTGTASQVDGSAGPGSTSVTVPADATACVAFWAQFDGTGANEGIGAITLGGNAFTVRSEINAGPIPGSDKTGTGVATLTNLPGTGTQTFAWGWAGADARSEGGGIFLVWVKNVNLADLVRDAGTDSQEAGTTVSVTINSITTDLVLSLGQGFASAFSTADIIFIDNAVVNGEHYDVGEYIAGASSTTCGLFAYDYSTVAGISLKDSAAPPAVTVTTNPIPVRHARETSW